MSMEREIPDRFEVKGYTYHFAAGIDTALFQCERCGAVVFFTSIAKHNYFHSTLNVLASMSGVT